MHELWSTLAARAGLTLTEKQERQLHGYLDALSAANERMNLTRIIDRPSAEVMHVGDALTLLPHLPPTPHRLIDVGSGGGVPGLVLAIARPDATVTLVEATGKKCEFLMQTAADLRLDNVDVVNARAEDIGSGELRHCADVVTARAVGALAWLAEWCLPLAAKGGKVLAPKGPRHVDELVEAEAVFPLLNGGTPIIHKVDLPGSTGLVIVEIPKLGKTPPAYPRPATVAKGKPLGKSPRKPA